MDDENEIRKIRSEIEEIRSETEEKTGQNTKDAKLYYCAMNTNEIIKKSTNKDSIIGAINILYEIVEINDYGNYSLNECACVIKNNIKNISKFLENEEDEKEVIAVLITIAKNSQIDEQTLSNCKEAFSNIAKNFKNENLKTFANNIVKIMEALKKDFRNNTTLLKNLEEEKITKYLGKINEEVYRINNISHTDKVQNKRQQGKSCGCCTIM